MINLLTVSLYFLLFWDGIIIKSEAQSPPTRRPRNTVEPTESPTTEQPTRPTSKPSKLPSRKPTLVPTGALGVCTKGVYWTVTLNKNTVNGLSCSQACAAEPIPTVCAGDFPTYGGWPYDSDQLADIYSKLDKTRFSHLKNCDVTKVFSATNDDFVPEFYYFDGSDKTECSPFYIMKATHKYKCSRAVKFTTNLLCPCCLNGKI